MQPLSGKVERLFEKIAALTAGYPWHTIAATLIITAVAGWSITKLPIYTSRQALLAPSSPEVERFDSFMQNFGAASDLIVPIEKAPRPVLEEFAIDLAEALRQKPTVKTADARLDLKFFLEHAYVSVPMKEFSQAEGFIKKLLDLPPNISLDPNEGLQRAEEYFEDPPPLPTDSIDLDSASKLLDGLKFFLAEWERWIDAKESPNRIAWEDFLVEQPEARKLMTGNGFYESHDGTMLFVFVRNVVADESQSAVRPFVDEVRATIKEVRDKYKAEGKTVPTAGLAGMPAILVEEFESIQDGALFTVTSSGVMVLLLIFFIMRSVRRAIVVFASMGVGAVWGLAMVHFSVGHMTMITTAFTAILFGLGVDYGIFLSSRILEERANGLDLLPAIARGTGLAAPAVLKAGGATTLVFLSLAFVEFTGFSELGMVAASGVVAVQLATFLVLPALFAILKPILTDKGIEKAQSASSTRQTKGMPKLLAATIAMVAVGLGALGIWGGTKIPYDYNVLSLLPKDSEAAYYAGRMVKESDFQSEVVILTAKDIEEARNLAEKASKLDTIAKVQSIVELFPKDIDDRVTAARKIGDVMTNSVIGQYISTHETLILAEDSTLRIAGILDSTLEMVEEFQETAFSAGHKKIVEALEPIRERLQSIAGKLRADPSKAGVANQAFLGALYKDSRNLVDVLSSWKSAAPMTQERLPKNLGDRFFGKNGTVAVYLYPKNSVYVMENLDPMLEQVYELSQSATGFPTTHQKMSRTAVSSFYKGTFSAALVALIFLAISLRGISGLLVASLPLVIGEGWMLGLLYIFGLTFNYANMIALPLLMALALDYGIWFAHREQELRQLGPWQAIKVAGMPIMLAALTTLAGLGAITFAEYRGISSLGISVTIGLVSSLAAALIVSPAVAQLFVRGKK